MQQRLAVILLVLTSLIPGSAAAQSLYFAAPAVSGTAPTYAGWTPFTFTDAAGKPERDSGVAHLNLPPGFKFMFYDREYSSLDVTADGLILFENTDPVTGARSPCTGALLTKCQKAGANLPDPNAPKPMLAFWWFDMLFGSAGSAESTTSGVAPNRIFSIRLTNWGSFAGVTLPPVGLRSVQIDLAETTGAIDIYYGDVATAGSDTESAATGLVDRTAADAVVLLGCTNTTTRCRRSAWPAGKYIHIQPHPEPDLAVVSFTGNALAPVTVNGVAGYEVQVTTSLANRGIGDANAFRYGIYLSDDSTIDPGTDTALLAPASPLSVPGRSLSSITDTVRFPRPVSGAMYVGVVLDPLNEVAEISEANNVGRMGPYLIGVELTGEVTAPSSATPGGKVDLGIVLKNDGSDAAGPFDYVLYLSDKSTWGATGALPIGTPGKVAGLLPGATLTLTPTVKLPPSAEGTWYVYLQVDPATPTAPNGAVLEVTENKPPRRAAQALQLTRTNLIASDVTFAPVGDCAGRPCLFFGDTLRVSWKITNEGPTAARGFTSAAALSTYAPINLRSAFMVPTEPACTGPLTLQPKQTVPVSCTFTIPTHNTSINRELAADLYFVGVAADLLNEVDETVKVDNLAATTEKVFVRHPAMDLAAARLEAPETAAVGELIAIERVIRNVGVRGNDKPGDPPFKYKYFLSSNESITTDDRELPILVAGALVAHGEGHLAVGAEDRSRELVQIPFDLSSGTWFIGMMIDPGGDVPELDERNNTVTALGTIEIAPSTLRVETTTLADALLGTEYRQELVASGGDGGFAWSVETGHGDLPRGLGLSTDGVLSGRPEVAGIFGFTVRVTSGTLATLARLVLRVSEPSGAFVILTTQLPSAIVGRQYDSALAAVGGVRPYTWSITDGELPSGLALSPDGAISGTPNQASEGNVTFKVAAKDAWGARATATLELRVGAPGKLWITTALLAEAYVGRTYVQQLATRDAVGPCTWRIVGGSLPEGLRLDSSGALAALSGVPSRVGVWAFRVEVADSAQHSDSGDFVIAVLPQAARFAPVILPEAIRGERYTFDLSGNASPGARFDFASGELAPGLELQQTGQLVGMVPNSADARSYDFIMQVSEATGASGLVPLTVRVVAPERVRPPPAGCSTAGGELVLPWALLVALATPLLRIRRRR